MVEHVEPSLKMHYRMSCGCAIGVSSTLLPLRRGQREPSQRRFGPEAALRKQEPPSVASPKRDEREVALKLLARTRRQGPVTLVGDKGYAGKAFAQAVSDMNATILRPRRKDEPGRGPHLAPIRQRVESIFWTCKGTLTLEHHGARTLAGLRERVLQRLLTLAAAISLNYQLGRPSRALVNYCA
jgi:hypothetical protein